jgi:hypothetical protein
MAMPREGQTRDRLIRLEAEHEQLRGDHDEERLVNGTRHVEVTGKLAELASKVDRLLLLKESAPPVALPREVTDLISQLRERSGEGHTPAHGVVMRKGSGSSSAASSSTASSPAAPAAPSLVIPLTVTSAKEALQLAFWILGGLFAIGGSSYLGSAINREEVAETAAEVAAEVVAEEVNASPPAPQPPIPPPPVSAPVPAPASTPVPAPAPASSLPASPLEGLVPQR